MESIVTFVLNDLFFLHSIRFKQRENHGGIRVTNKKFNFHSYVSSKEDIWYPVKFNFLLGIPHIQEQRFNIRLEMKYSIWCEITI